MYQLWATHCRRILHGESMSALDTAQERGLLRLDVARVELCAWVQTVLTSLAGRSDLDAEALRTTLRNFLIPAILVRDRPMPPTAMTS